MQIYSNQTEQEQATARKASGECGCGGCGCGADAPQDAPRGAEPQEVVVQKPAAADIDVRAIPREVRHARVIGEVTALVPEESLVVAAPHDPRRLLDEIEVDVAGEFAFDYVDAGPELWRVRVTRITCC